MFAFIFAFYYLGAWVDGLLSPGGPDDEGRVLTPVAHAASLIATALLVPWSMVLQRWLYGVRGASLTSVVSRFRFGLFGKGLLAVGPTLLIALAISEHVTPYRTTEWLQSDVIWLLVASFLLVPLQCAGEEYGLRGLVFRIAASWGRGRTTSLILGIGVSSVIFSAIHTTGNPMWNLFYVIFSVTTAFITWRTGGLEIAIVLHAVVNTLTFIFWIALNADLAERLDRSAPVSPSLVIASSLVFVGAAVVVWLRTRRSGPATTPSGLLEQ
ncbi:CPBP family intramembrane glutamic endopeptidase [Promicromonospora sp. CA-289599]|uniref:CPBP family intramembrane glutamic endopeptidase n=1 Tax=Promicromonospora sp. CA-289599 TaxID=3240014 RepID=UPI003D8D52CE